MKAMGFKILLGFSNQAERFVIAEIEELAFIRRIDARDNFRAGVFISTACALMEEPVNHNLVFVRGECVQPGAETAIGQGAAQSMVIGNDEKRAGVHSVACETRENFLDLRPGRRSDVMDRDDKGALHGVASS